MFKTTNQTNYKWQFSIAMLVYQRVKDIPIGPSHMMSSRPLHPPWFFGPAAHLRHLRTACAKRTFAENWTLRW